MLVLFRRCSRWKRSRSVRREQSKVRVWSLIMVLVMVLGLDMVLTGCYFCHLNSTTGHREHTPPNTLSPATVTYLLSPGQMLSSSLCVGRSRDCQRGGLFQAVQADRPSSSLLSVRRHGNREGSRSAVEDPGFAHRPLGPTVNATEWRGPRAPRAPPSFLPCFLPSSHPMV